MAGLYGRVSARGYASGADTGELTGAASLEATQALRRPSASPQDWHQSPTTLTGFSPDPVAPLTYDVLDEEWGLPGELADPLSSPGYGPGYTRTHAAPRPGWAGSYHPITAEGWEELGTLHANSHEIHAADFGMPARLTNTLADNVAQQPVDHWTSNDPGGHTNQAPLTGVQRSMGYLSKDAIQGYDRRNRYGFDAGHRSRDSYPGYHDKTHGQPLIYIDPAERPFIVPQAQGSFTPTDAIQGPERWTSDLHGESVNYNPPSGYSAPPEPDTLSRTLTEAMPSAGWADA